MRAGFVRWHVRSRYLQMFGGGVFTTAANGSLLTIVFIVILVLALNFSTFSLNLNKVG